MPQPAATQCRACRHRRGLCGRNTQTTLVVADRPGGHAPLLLGWFLGRRGGGFFAFYRHGIPLVEPTLKVDHLAAGAAKRHGDRLLGIEASAANRTLLMGHRRTTPQIRLARLPAPKRAAGASKPLLLHWFPRSCSERLCLLFPVPLHHMLAPWNHTASMMLALRAAVGYRKTAPHGRAGRLWRSIRLPASWRVKRLRAFCGRRPACLSAGQKALFHAQTAGAWHAPGATGCAPTFGGWQQDDALA